MGKFALTIFLIGLVITSSPAQKFEYTRQAEIDAQGNIYVSSDHGSLIKMADKGHCLEVIVASDRQTVACMVWLKSEEPPRSTELEIYLKGGQRKAIESGADIGNGISGNRGSKCLSTRACVTARAHTHCTMSEVLVSFKDWRSRQANACYLNGPKAGRNCKMSPSLSARPSRKSERSGLRKFCGRWGRSNPECGVRTS